MSKIYLVEACIEYEGCNPLQAYRSGIKATTVCEDYNKSLKSIPKYSLGASDEDIDKYLDDLHAWEDRTGLSASIDWYSVREVDLDEELDK